MKTLLIFSLVALSAVAANVEVKPFIVGGVEAPRHQYTFLGAIFYQLAIIRLHVCGGSLISRRWVLTAAHCLTEVPAIGHIEVEFGSHDHRVREAGLQVVRINRAQSILHPDWVPGGQVGPDDLALMAMNDNIEYSPTVQAIRLPPRNVVPTGSAIAAGWGATGSMGNAPSNILLQAELQFITIPTCRALINTMGFDGNLVDYTNVCTAPRPGTGVCSGDSGGPLFQRDSRGFVLQGVVSWGMVPCGSAGAPSGVFKKVSAYIDWIHQHTGISPS